MTLTTTVRTRRRWLLLLLALGSTVGLLAGVVWTLTLLGESLATVLVLLAYLGAHAAGLRAWYGSLRERRGVVGASADELTLDGRRLLRREDIGHAFVLKDGGRTFVRFGRLLQPIDVEVDDDGAALFEVLRLDPKQSLARQALGFRSWRRSLAVGALNTAGPIGALVALGALAFRAHVVPIGWLGVAAVLTYGWMIAAALHEIVTLEVGSDGITIRHWIGRRRFIPFSAVEGAALRNADLEIRLRSGEVVTMHSAAARKNRRGGALLKDGHKAPDALLERIETQLAAHRASTLEAAAFERRGRSAEEWLASVSAAVDTRASFRTSATPPDVLWRIVEDTAVPPTARAGAAAALRGDLDDDGRQRLRDLAGACAGERLRVALVSVADDSDLHASFDPLDDEAAPKRAALRRHA
ncbi:MAG: PH domain-containing protein [Labilithrix sp.]|nr:PH domain-containing protein [Labilithrix sp.]MCW5813097.1 PH domain-containing protein [Labilithrix sp.]